MTLEPSRPKGSGMSTTVAMNRDTTIALKGGFVVPVEALRLAWRLEEIGVSMRVEDDALVLRPRDRVPPDAVPLLRRYRRDIMRIVRYVQYGAAVPA